MGHGPDKFWHIQPMKTQPSHDLAHGPNILYIATVYTIQRCICLPSKNLYNGWGAFVGILRYKYEYNTSILISNITTQGSTDICILNKVNKILYKVIMGQRLG